MSFQRVQRLRSKNTNTSRSSSRVTPRTFSLQQTNSPPTQAEIENKAFEKHKFEAFGLNLQEKHGTITPQGKEQQSVLQGKMNDSWAQRMERGSRFGYNFANIPIHRPDAPISAPIQPQLTKSLATVRRQRETMSAGEETQMNLLQQSPSSSLQTEETQIQRQGENKHQARCGCPVCSAANSRIQTKLIQGKKAPLIQRKPLANSVTLFSGGRVVQRGLWSSIKNAVKKVGSVIADGVKKFGQGFAGLAQRFGQGFINLANKFGKGFVDMAAKFGQGFVNLASRFGKGFVDLASRFGQNFVNLAGRFGKGFIDLAGKLGQGFINIVSKFGSIVVDLAQKFGKVFIDLAGRFGKVFVDLAQKFGKGFIDLAGKLGQGFINIVSKFGSIVVDLAQKFGKVFVDLAQKFGKVFVDLAQKFGKAFINLAQKIGQTFINLVSSFGKIVIDLATKFGIAFVSLLEKIGKRFIELVQKYGKIVLNFVKYFGIQLWDKVVGIFLRAIEWIKKLPTRISRLLLNVWEGVKSLKPWSLSWWQSLGKASTWIGLLEWLGTVIIDLVEIAGVGEMYETLMDFVKFNTRTLTGGEIAKAQNVFGNSINYNLVRVDEHALIGPSWTDREYTSFHTINGWGGMDDHTLIHELAHVWQYEHAGAIYMPQAIHAQGTKAGYDYGGKDEMEKRQAAGQGFSSFNREQQAQLIADYYALKNGIPPSAQAHGATTADLPLYEYFAAVVSH